MYCDISATTFSNLNGVHIEVNTLQISPIHIIMSKTVEFPGMVGECVTDCSLFLLNTNSMQVTPMTYEEGRQMYRFTTGRDLRKAFWRLLRWHSPKASQQRYEATTADAISRII